MALMLQASPVRRNAMKSTTGLFLALALACLGGCYAATPYGGDGGVDAQQDNAGPDQVLPDSPCMVPLEPAFTALEYDTIVPAHETIVITVHHTEVLLPSAGVALDGNVILVTLSGTQCACAMCPDVEPSSVSEARIEGGLPAGEYMIRIQGADFPLLVVEEACQRNAAGVETYDSTCPEEARVGAPAAIGFTAYGTGCDCGGFVDTSWELVDMGESYAPAMMITAEEVVCDPSQCCVGCRCMDMYDVDLQVIFPVEGFIPTYVNNDTYLCSTMVFGEDGCSEWTTSFSDIVACPEQIEYGLPLEVTVSVSSGYCCSGEAYVEEQREGDTVTLTPKMHVCEGSCCYMCDCMDYNEVTYAVTGLDIGYHRICVQSSYDESCIEVFVYGLD
jgi:hypothetical protein